MKNIFTRSLFLLMTFIFFSCRLPTVGYLNIQPFIKAYKTEVDKNLTIVLDTSIPDSLEIQSAGIKKMTIKQFRETLEDALKNTFKSTYTETNVEYTFNQKGISLYLVKVTPDWNKKSSRTIVTGNNGHVTSNTKYELETKITYQAVVYSDGEKIGVIDGIAFSEKSTFKRKETPEVFQDGVKIMCEEIYKQLVAYK